MRSVARLDHKLLGAGSVFNVRFSVGDLDREETLEKIATIIEKYLHLGGMQIQPVLTDVSTLRNAREHPERYSDLVVRVCGYSAHFTELCKEIQDEIIARSEYQV
jgi:formate C-acetyltransferase